MSPFARDTCGAVVIALVLSVALTWPLAARLGSAGRIDSGDGRHGIWNVSWVAHALTTAPSTLFDANIFFPHDNTLAFSEANLVAGILAIPAWLVTDGNPYAAYNSVVLLAFAFAALASYLLARTVGAGRFGAALAAIIYGYSPFMFAHIPHIQLLMTFGPPLSLAMMHRFVSTPTMTRAISLGLALSVTGLACGYYGIFSGLIVALGIVWFSTIDGRWRQPRYWMYAGLAAALVVALIAPFLLPYLDIRQEGFGRTLEDARLYSATGRAYFASPVRLHTWMLPLLGTWREVLFPGFQALVFGGAALVLEVRYRRAFAVPALVAFYGTTAVLAIWISLGPDAGLYTVLYHTTPAFSFLRAPARTGILVTLALAVLTGLTLTWLQARGWARWRWVAPLVLVIAVAESWVGPLRLADAPAIPRAHARLAVVPRAPVAEFPFYAGGPRRHQHTEYMLLSAFHWQPLINGYSDHIPEEFFAVKGALEAFPALEALDALQEQQVRWIVVHFHRYPDGESPAMHEALQNMPSRVRPVIDDGKVALYELIWRREVDDRLKSHE